MSFDFIETERLKIGRLSQSDAKAMSVYRSLPEVSRNQSWTTFPEEEASKLIDEMEGSDPSFTGKWFQFSISLKEDKRLIGDIGFLNTGEDAKSWVGFTLDSAFWRRGFATEAVQKVLQYYFQLGISEVWASIDPKNSGSRSLLLKLGFKLVDEEPDDLVFHKQLG